MRTEKEIRARIEAVDRCFIKLLRNWCKGNIPSAVFEKLYSDAWEEEVALYWALGMSRKNVATLVASKFMGMLDELKKHE